MTKRTFLFLSIVLGAWSAHGAVTIGLSGGDDTPLTLTIPYDITFTAVSPGMSQYGIVIRAASPYNVTSSTALHSGSAVWDEGGTSSGGGLMGTLAHPTSPRSELYVFWGSDGDQSGSLPTMTLSAGTRTTISALGIEYPQGFAQYEVSMINSNLIPVSNEGTQVPEPSTYAALAGVLILCLAALKRRRRA